MPTLSIASFYRWKYVGIDFSLFTAIIVFKFVFKLFVFKLIIVWN